MKKILFLPALALLSSCFTARLNFEDNYAQWRLNADSDIVYNDLQKLKFDFFIETDLKSLNNKDHADGEFGDEPLHFVTSETYSPKILRNKFFSKVFAQIPVFDSAYFIIADDISLFSVKDSESWKPDYITSALGEPDWRPVDSGDFVFSDSTILRNFVFDKANMLFITVDRLMIKGKAYGMAYPISTKSKKFNFNAYCCNVTKPENIYKDAVESEFFSQFSLRFVRENNFGIPIDYEAVNKKLNVSRDVKFDDKIPASSFNDNNAAVYYDKSLKAAYESSRQLIFDFGKDKVLGFDCFYDGNADVIGYQSDAEKRVTSRIPLYKRTIANLSDRIIIFEFDDSKKWRPNYEVKADEMFVVTVDDEYFPGGKSDIWTPNHKSQPYNFIWRNLLFDKAMRQVYVVDRMNLKDNNIGIAYIIGDSSADLTDPKNCLVARRYLDGLMSFSRRIAQNNNYWTVLK